VFSRCGGRTEAAAKSRRSSSTADPVPTIGVDDAIERLNLGDDPFVFFVDVSPGRGAVLYRRYDGHYGLVTAETGT